MIITDYLQPHDIKILFDNIKRAMSEKQSIDVHLANAKNELEVKKSEFQVAPGFAPAKNQALQDLAYLAAYPAEYKRVFTLEQELKKIQNKLSELRETQTEYKYIIDYFQAAAYIPAQE